MDEHDYDYRERLSRDVAGWRRAGIIDEAQERAILARAGAGEPKAVGALRMGWLVSAVSVVGAIVLAAGVVLLFAANWEEMPDAFRTGLVVAAIVAAYAIGYALVYRFDMQRTGSAFFLLGVLLYHAGIFLIAQIYNMPVESPWLWLLGAAGAFPMAYAFRTRIVLLLAIADITTWVVVALVTRYEEFPESMSVLVVVGVLGVAMYAAGRLHELRTDLRHYAETYALAGALILLGLVYVFTFDEPWRELIDSADAYAAPPVIYVSIVLASVLTAVQWVTSQRRDVTRHLEAVAQLGLLALAAVVSTWPEWTGYAVVFNGVFFGVAGAFIARGYLLADERYVNGGLAALAVGLITRYVDVFWSLLAGSAFFIVGGVLLLALAWAAERVRREIIRGMAEGGPAVQGVAS
ncbi:MAG: DUF2157 domain-containing protein [Dehalococcoidia bacterium]